MAGGGVDHQAHRLVDGDDVVVLIDDVQGDVLGHHVDGGGVGQHQHQLVPGIGLVVLLYRLAVEGDRPLLQQLLGRRAGELGQLPGQELVGPLPRLVGDEVQGGHAFSSSLQNSRK